LKEEKTMDETRKSILRMVAEGKITPDDAEQLFDALAEDERQERRRALAPEVERASGWNWPWEQHGWKWPWEEHGWPWEQPGWKWPWDQPGWPWPSPGRPGGREPTATAHTLTVEEGTELVLHWGGGDVTLVGTSEPELRLSGTEFPCAFTEKEGQVCLSAGGSNATLHVPAAVQSLNVSVGGGDLQVEHLTASLVAHVSGGDLTVQDFTGDLEVAAEGGDVALREVVFGHLNARSSGGDVEVSRPATLREGAVKLRSEGGDVTLVLPADSALDLVAQAEGGEVRTDLPLEPDEQTREIGRGVLRGRLNGGGAQVELKAAGGDVILLARQE